MELSFGKKICRELREAHVYLRPDMQFSVEYHHADAEIEGGDSMIPIRDFEKTQAEGKKDVVCTKINSGVYILNG